MANNEQTITIPFDLLEQNRYTIHICTSKRLHDKGRKKKKKRKKNYLIYRVCSCTQWKKFSQNAFLTMCSRARSTAHLAGGSKDDKWGPVLQNENSVSEDSRALMLRRSWERRQNTDRSRRLGGVSIKTAGTLKQKQACNTSTDACDKKNICIYIKHSLIMHPAADFYTYWEILVISLIQLFIANKGRHGWMKHYLGSCAEYS